ncbi:MAG: TonB family protein [Pyrinomonadaceae bacterium]
MFTLSFSLHAQQAQLTLADLLIGLRSKKVSLVDRNTILTQAVKQRGVTFSLSTDIEKELTATGAAKVLLDAIREKANVAVVPAPIQVATPQPTPKPPDFAFYQTRADTNLGKGEFSLALADYDRAVELKADDAIAFLNRGRTHYSLKAFERAGADYDKAIELDPKDSKAFYNRGVLFERLGNLDKAISDYQKAVDLDSGNDPAKLGLKKLLDEQQAKLASQPPPVKPPVVETVKAPETMNLGSLTAANAVRMVTPVYASIAQKTNVEGRVTVEVAIDEQGNVTSAKAVNGHQLLRGSAEDAAKRSKFKPALFGEKAIKAIGSITYNFSLKQPR